VVQERGDRPQTELAHPFEPLVGPAPVRACGAVRLDPLPEHRIADRAQTERGEPVEVVQPVVMAVQPGLVDDLGADPRHRALDTTPHLERGAVGVSRTLRDGRLAARRPIRRELCGGGTRQALAHEAASLLKCRRWPPVLLATRERRGHALGLWTAVVRPRPPA
jgi:hypothetical protein